MRPKPVIEVTVSDAKRFLENIEKEWPLLNHKGEPLVVDGLCKGCGGKTTVSYDGIHYTDHVTLCESVIQNKLYQWAMIDIRVVAVDALRAIIKLAAERDSLIRNLTDSQRNETRLQWEINNKVEMTNLVKQVDTLEQIEQLWTERDELHSRISELENTVNNIMSTQLTLFKKMDK